MHALNPADLLKGDTELQGAAEKVSLSTRSVPSAILSLPFALQPQGSVSHLIFIQRRSRFILNRGLGGTELVADISHEWHRRTQLLRPHV